MLALLAGCSSSHAVGFQPAPTALRMPSIDVDSEIVAVVADERVLDVPAQPWVVGWWSGGSAPGDDSGTVVLDVHLDTLEHGDGPFVRVDELVAGDPAEIVGHDGTVHRYEVSDVRAYTKTVLPYAELFRQQGPPQAVIVTCGGRFDPETGWDSNVVVMLTPASR